MGVNIEAIVLFVAFWIFGGAAARDALTGRIPLVLLLLPITIVGLVFPTIFLIIFLPVCGIFLIIHGSIGLLKRRGYLKKDVVYLGSGDVLAVPLALMMSYAAHPFLGPTAFVATFAALLPVFRRRPTRRLLPWLVPPLAAALLISFLTPLGG